MPSAKALKAGRAVIELSLLKGAVEKQLKSLQARTAAIGSAFTRIGAVGMAAGGAVTGAFAAAVKTFVSVGSSLNDISERTGLSTEALSRLGFGAQQVGADMSTLETGMTAMNSLLLMAGRGSKRATATLDDLGISLERLNSLSPEERFTALAEAISRVEDPGKRMALAVKAL